jgi:alcohol dehydrogenase YqhD (iron-dependent ADH family)
MRTLDTNDWIFLNSIIYKIYARNVWDIKAEDDYEAANAGIDLTEKFFIKLGLPTKLSELGIDDSQFELMASEAVRTSGLSSRAYVKLDAGDVAQIYRDCL